MSSDERERGSGARLLLLLDLIAEAEGEFILKDLAHRARLPISSVHRLLQILVKAGLVERAGGVAYRPGRELFRLASRVLRHMDYPSIARPFVKTLWDRWQETSVFSLYRPANHTALVVELIQTPHQLRHVLEPNTELSLLWGSLGRSILAHLPQDEFAAAYAEAGLGPITNEPPISKSALIKELEKIRAAGVAVFRSDEAELAGVAAPVFAGGVVIGSLGVTQPTYRFARLDLDELVASVRSAASDLSEAMGHRFAAQE